MLRILISWIQRGFLHTKDMFDESGEMHNNVSVSGIKMYHLCVKFEKQKWTENIPSVWPFNLFGRK